MMMTQKEMMLIVQSLAEIGELCVVPQYRNKGIAKFMLNYIKESANALHRSCKVVCYCR